MPSCWAATAISVTGMPTMPNMYSTSWGQEQGDKRPGPRQTFPPGELTGKSHANLPPRSDSHHSPRLQDDTLAPEGFRRSLSLQEGQSYLRFQGLGDDRGTRHLPLSSVAGLCEITFRHLPLKVQHTLAIGSTLTQCRPAGNRKAPGNTPIVGPPSSDWQKEGSRPL